MRPGRAERSAPNCPRASHVINEASPLAGLWSGEAAVPPPARPPDGDLPVQGVPGGWGRSRCGCCDGTLCGAGAKYLAFVYQFRILVITIGDGASNRVLTARGLLTRSVWQWCSVRASQPAPVIVFMTNLQLQPNDILILTSTRHPKVSSFIAVDTCGSRVCAIFI